MDMHGLLTHTIRPWYTLPVPKPKILRASLGLFNKTPDVKMLRSTIGCVHHLTDTDWRRMTPDLVDTDGSRTAVQLETTSTPEVHNFASFSYSRSTVARRRRPCTLPLRRDARSRCSLTLSLVACNVPRS